MIKKVCMYISLFFIFILNIVIEVNINNYFEILKMCFGNDIVLTTKSYTLICFIIALISILIVLDILLVVKKEKINSRGIKFKSEDGSYGTAEWMQEKEINTVLGVNNVPGIILGKYKNDIVKLPFDSYFNKNICVFGSSR